jgi:hypothetical protein
MVDARQVPTTSASLADGRTINYYDDVPGGQSCASIPSRTNG